MRLVNPASKQENVDVSSSDQHNDSCAAGVTRSRGRGVPRRLIFCGQQSELCRVAAIKVAVVRLPGSELTGSSEQMQPEVTMAAKLLSVVVLTAVIVGCTEAYPPRYNAQVNWQLPRLVSQRLI